MSAKNVQPPTFAWHFLLKLGVDLYFYGGKRVVGLEKFCWR